MSDDLLRKLRATARLDDRIHAHMTAVSSGAESHGMTTPCGVQQREVLLQQFLDATPIRRTARRRTAGRTAVLLLPVMLATAAALFIAWRPADRAAAQDKLMGYELSVGGGVMAQRGSRISRMVAFKSGDRVRILLTPPTPVRGSLDLRVVATHSAQQLELAWPWRMDPTEGAIEIEGPADDLLHGGAGRWTLTVELRDLSPPRQLRDRLITQVEVSH